MIIESSVAPKEFIPVEFKITFETRKEIENLYFLISSGSKGYNVFEDSTIKLLDDLKKFLD